MREKAVVVQPKIYPAVAWRK